MFGHQPSALPAPRQIDEVPDLATLLADTPAGEQLCALLRRMVEHPSLVASAGLARAAVVAMERQRSWQLAVESRLHVAMVEQFNAMYETEPNTQDGELAFQSASAEVAAGLGISRRSAETQVKDNYELGTARVATRNALEAGLINSRHVFAITRTLLALDPNLADVVEQELLQDVVTRERKGLSRLSPAQLAKRATKLALEIDPEEANRAYQQRVKEREVRVERIAPGIARFSATMPVYKAVDLFDRLTQIANGAAADDPRTLEQRRVDALIELAGIVPEEFEQPVPRLLAEPSQLPPLPRREVGILMTWETATGLKDSLATFDDYAIPTDLARELASTARWRRWVVEPQSGALLDVGATTYVPSEAFARFIRARDRHCRFPGSDVASRRCDADHVEPFNHDDPASGGRTVRDNVIAVSRTPHRLKTHAGWKVNVTDHRGGCEWISPTGARYLVPPTDHGGPLRD